MPRALLTWTCRAQLVRSIYSSYFRIRVCFSRPMQTSWRIDLVIFRRLKHFLQQLLNYPLMSILPQHTGKYSTTTRRLLVVSSGAIAFNYQGRLMRRKTVTSIDTGVRSLIATASQTLNTHFTPGRHHVACALRTKNGKVYRGLQLDCAGFDTCAEPTAIASACL